MSHAKLSPSSSARWIACPASIGMTERALREHKIAIAPPSFFASEGTAAHHLAEQVLSDGINPFSLEGTQCEVENAITITREMCGHVQDYADLVRSFVTSPEDTMLVEARVRFTDWVPNGYGTSDVIIMRPTDIVCIDLKYGKGIPVVAEGNTQAMLYALGAYQGLSPEYREKIKSVTMVIHQPRLDSVSECVMPIEDLLREGERISQAAQLALSDEPGKPSPGDEQCRWCPVEPICKARAQQTYDLLGQEFEDVSTPVDTLDDAALAAALTAKPAIESWLSAVEKYVTERLHEGHSFDGFKLVEGRSVRRWSNEEEASDVLYSLLGDAAYTKKVLSPAQAEKTLGKKSAAHIQSMIVKPEGRPTLVPDSDPRPSVTISVEDF